MFDVITFGTATRDAFLFSKDELDIESDKHAPTGKVIALPLEAKLELKNIMFTGGGGATNAAVTFARQKLTSACVCKIGNDAGGRAIFDELENENVGTKLIAYDKKQATGYSVILDVGPKGRTVLVYRGASASLMKSDISWKNLKAKWFYIAPLGGDSLNIFGPLFNFAQKNKIKVAVNPSSAFVKLGIKKLAPWLSHVDAFILNREEASYLTGFSYNEEEKIFRKMDELVRGLVVVTDGSNGVKVSDGKTRWSAGIFQEKEVADRTGAGDAFGSGLVAMLIKGKTVEEGICAGSANATSVVEHIGAKKGILNAKELSGKRWKNFKIIKKLI